MYKITETYTDYDDNQRTEDFYFNYSEAELTDLQFSVSGGLAGMIDKIIKTNDMPKLVELFRELIQKAYGEKSNDGRRFMKSPELTKEFTETVAYSQIYMRLATDSKAAQEFINKVVPKSMKDKMQQANQQNVVPMK
nr:MAG TPA: hypothetical protein [Caudoviricetes sp.]